MTEENTQVEVTGGDGDKNIEFKFGDKSLKLVLTGDHGADQEFIDKIAGDFESLANAQLGNVYNTTYSNAKMGFNPRNCQCTATGTFARGAVFSFAPELRAAVDALADRQQSQQIAV